MGTSKAKDKESITFYDKGFALAGKAGSTHTNKEYSILRDETVEGVRTIVLKTVDESKKKKKVKELTKALAAAVGEEDSKVFRALIKDVLNDYWDDTLDKLYNMVIKDQMPVKAAEGCFKLIIGDGRKSSSEEIMLRE